MGEGGVARIFGYLNGYVFSLLRFRGNAIARLFFFFLIGHSNDFFFFSFLVNGLKLNINH